jgi:hypothetical protein
VNLKNTKYPKTQDMAAKPTIISLILKKEMPVRLISFLMLKYGKNIYLRICDMIFNLSTVKFLTCKREAPNAPLRSWL